MQQKTKQLIMTLVALLALTTHAWAMWTGGTYTATASEVNLNSVNVTDDATLTINQNFTVRTGSISISAGKTLTVVGPGDLVVGGITGSGTIIVKGNASLRVYGADGSDGADGDNGSDGGDGAAAIMCSITIYSGSIQAYGGHGGAGGDGDSGSGGDGGDAGPAFGGSGTLTYYGGSIEAFSGSVGAGGEGVLDGGSGEDATAFAYTYNVVFENQPTSIQDAYDNPIDINNIKGAVDIKILGDDADAVTGTTVAITWSEATKTATLTNGMPAGNVTVSVEYFPQAEFAKSTDPTPVPLAPAAIANVPANTDAPIVTPGTVANIGTSEVPQGTLMYFVKQADGNTAPAAPTYDTEGWTDKVPTADGLAQGDVYVWYYIEGAEPATIANRTDANTRSDSDIKLLGTNGIVTLDPEPTYDVSLNKTGMAEGEPALWSAKSTNVAEVNLGEADLKGVKKTETVTVTYSGTKKIIGVKAEKKALTLDLATVTEDTTVEDGYTVIGMLGANVKISIANGATVKLDGVSINGVNNVNYMWAGITCLGDATIILSGTNTVKGFFKDYPGIQAAAAGKTLIINGTGSLTASSYGLGAGIGGKRDVACGDIEIQGGTITATSGSRGAGIGGGDNASCGNITISGGTVTATGGVRGAGIGGGRRGTSESDVSCGNILISGGTVTATGGAGAAGIGGGRGFNSDKLSSCGTITITTGVTKVTATKGENAPNSIGAGKDGTCGTVTIGCTLDGGGNPVGGTTGQISTSTYTYQPSN